MSFLGLFFYLDVFGRNFRHAYLHFKCHQLRCSLQAARSLNLLIIHCRALFPCGDDLVCIIDDREDVWQGCGNLVQVKPYHFFRHTGDINAPPGLDKSDVWRTPEPENTNINETCIKSLSKDKKNDAHKLLDEPLSSDNTSTKEINLEINKTCDKPEEANNGDTKVDTEEEVDSKTQSTNANETEVETASASDVSDVSKSQSITESKAESDTASKDDAMDKAVTEVVPSEEIEKNSKQETLKNDNNVIDEDDDDYLLYLEDILRRIHTEFYYTLDKGNGRRSLRDIIPRVRSQVLKGLCLTFSGLIPTHQKLHQSRAYKVARAFGAEVTQVRRTYNVAILIILFQITLHWNFTGFDREDYAFSRY